MDFDANSDNETMWKQQQRQSFVVLLISGIVMSLLFYQHYVELDFIGHFFGFYFLSWLINKLCQFPRINLALCLITYAAITEWVQSYLGYRNGEFSDFVADALGVLVFCLSQENK